MGNICTLGPPEWPGRNSAQDKPMQVTRKRSVLVHIITWRGSRLPSAFDLYWHHFIRHCRIMYLFRYWALGGWHKPQSSLQFLSFGVDSGQVDGKGGNAVWYIVRDLGSLGLEYSQTRLTQYHRCSMTYPLWCQWPPTLPPLSAIRHIMPVAWNRAVVLNPTGTRLQPAFWSTGRSRHYILVPMRGAWGSSSRKSSCLWPQSWQKRYVHNAVGSNQSSLQLLSALWELCTSCTLFRCRQHPGQIDDHPSHGQYSTRSQTSIRSVRDPPLA